MDGKVLIFLCVLGLSCYCDAREMVNTYNNFDIISVFQPKNNQAGKDVRVAEVGRNEVCTLCEEFASDAMKYLSNNKTQTEIIEMLHQSCSKLRSFEQEDYHTFDLYVEREKQLGEKERLCIALVDYYAPLFFIEISLVQPSDFCQKVNLCELVVSLSERLSKESCDLCHQAVNEAVVKLKDPETQLEILEILLKACDATENYAKKCKNLVFEYAPLILANAEQFLEKNDICIMLHACDAVASDSKQYSSSSVEPTLHSVS
ncbi:scaffold/adaptor protein [Lithospermum erythrorhizon]|uniref:Pulmonary surfactant-associated protein B n=1 Tax=Lithospermum erythrorhizon TaxID=34254 RepID=A0AAV3QRG6_LITER